MSKCKICIMSSTKMDDWMIFKYYINNINRLKKQCYLKNKQNEILESFIYPIILLI